jgi:hypothetical protein
MIRVLLRKFDIGHAMFFFFEGIHVLLLFVQTMELRRWRNGHASMHRTYR